MRIASVIGCLCVSIIPAVSFGQVRDAAPAIPEVTASGRGEIRVAPDRGVVSVAIESREVVGSDA